MLPIYPNALRRIYGCAPYFSTLLSVFTLSLSSSAIYAVFHHIFLNLFSININGRIFFYGSPLVIEKYFKFISFLEEIQTYKDSVENKNLGIKNE